MNIDLLCEDNDHFTAYISYLPPGEKPGNAEDSAIARRLRCEVEDITWRACHLIADPVDAVNADEVDLWDEARQNGTQIWRLRGQIGSGNTTIPS